MVEEHFIKSAIWIESGNVKEIFEYAKVLVDAIVSRMSKNEVGYINESLETKAIPTPKYLIKYDNILTSNE